MKNKFIVLFISLMSISLFGQVKTWKQVEENLKIESVNYIKDFVNKNFDDYLNATHPNVIKMAGDKNILINMATDNLQMYESLGFRFGHVEVSDEVHTIDTNEGIQALVPVTIKLNNSEGDTDMNVLLHAISIDAGATWRFVDLSQYDSSSIKVFVPEFSEKLFAYWGK